MAIIKSIILVFIATTLVSCSSVTSKDTARKLVLLNRINETLSKPLFRQSARNRIHSLGDCRYSLDSHWNRNISRVKGFFDVKTNVTIIVPQEYLKTDVEDAYVKEIKENGTFEHWSDGIFIRFDDTVLGNFITRTTEIDLGSTDEYPPGFFSIGFSDRLQMDKVYALAADIDRLFSKCES